MSTFLLQQLIKSYIFKFITKFMFKIIIYLCCLAGWASTYKVSDFQEKILQPSPPSGFHTVETGDETIGQILAFGDLNGDQYNDYVAMLNSTSKNLYLYFWDPINNVFVRDQLSIQINNLKRLFQVMLSDLSSDGRQQVIVTYQKTDQNISTVIYELQNCTDFVCQKSLYLINNNPLDQMTNVPFLINLKAQKSPSFFIFEGPHRYILQVDQNSQNKNSQYIQYQQSTKKSFKEYIKQGHSDTFNLVNQHYASNIDFSGDCHSDLIIHSINSNNQSILQFYKKQINGFLSFTKQLTFELPIQYLTFIDFDSSGTIDIVLLLKNDTNYQLHILPNTKTSIEEQCQQNHDFPFQMKNLKYYDITDKLSASSKLIFGDIDSDSYPDLLTIITNKDFRKAQLYKNEEGQKNDRKFIPSKQLNANLISELKNPVQAAFFDLAENGILDIIITTEETKASNGEMSTTRNCIINNVKDDTLFIKILPLSQSSVYSLSSNKLSSAFGITIQWKITALDGNKMIKLMNQKSQWNYGTLQLPFVCGGLGRTNNYVEDLVVGYDGIGQKMNWSPIIPNSKLLIYEEDDEWSLETLLTNSERVNQVIYVSVGILIVLGIVIVVLSRKQKAEDRKDHYNFIQLIR